jgi:hypothetical protein
VSRRIEMPPPGDASDLSGWDAELVFYVDDERALWEAEARGCLSHVAVRLPDGTEYPVYFYDPVRLAQDLETVAESGAAVIAEPGMIVVPAVTPECMTCAIRELARSGYFDFLHPIRPYDRDNPDTRWGWPP